MQKYYDAALTLEGEEKEAILVILNLKRRMVCEICGGVGHLLQKCSTRRDLDRSFKELGLKTKWGELKSQIIKDSIVVNIFSKEEKKIITAKNYKRLQDERKNSANMQFKKIKVPTHDIQGNLAMSTSPQSMEVEKKDLAGNRRQQ
jgi:hypothetical protein